MPQVVEQPRWIHSAPAASAAPSAPDARRPRSRRVLRPVYRVIYLMYRLISGARYRATRRFTRTGLMVLAGLVAAAMMAVDTENTVAYQALSLLLCLLLVGAAASLFFRARFSATRVLPRFGTAGQPFSYKVELRNLTRSAQGDLVLLENLADPRPTFSEWLAMQLDDERKVRSFQFSRRRLASPFRIAVAREAPVPMLAPGEQTDARVEITPLRRGVIRFKGVTLARPDPLGLFRSFAHVRLPGTVLILPKRYPVSPAALPGTMKYQEGGVALASNVGRSEEFISLREYRRGDPLRHIHWRSWAKTGKPIVKEFEDEFFVRHALVLDTFTTDRHSEVFEEAVSVAASFACTIQTQESLLDLLFVGTEAYCFTAGRGLGHTDQLLEILAGVQPCRDRTFGHLEHLVLNHVSAVSGCICVLLAWDGERREFVRHLQALAVPVLVLVLAPPRGAASIETQLVAAGVDRFAVLEPGKVREGLMNV